MFGKCDGRSGLSQDEQIIQAHLKPTTPLQFEAEPTENRGSQPGVESVMLLERHAVDQADPVQGPDDVIDGGRGDGDDQSAAGTEEPKGLAAERDLVDDVF